MKILNCILLKCNQYFIDSQKLHSFVVVGRTMTNLKDDLQENTFLGVLMNGPLLDNVVAIAYYPSTPSSLHDMCPSMLMKVQNQFNSTTEYI